MSGTEPDSSLEAVQEVIADAAATGASLHIFHITSSGLRQTPVCLDMIAGARRRGIDVTTEAYPYTAASTSITAATFDPGWQDRLGITFKDLQWTATGGRLTEQSFQEYRRKGGLVIMHMIPEEVADLAVANPLVLISSDGLPFLTGGEHPRGAGTFARVLGHYVREKKALTLMDALRKMTLMPARRLDGYVPQMKNKGRIKAGADADLTIFDANRVIDRSTFERPMQPSEGIVHVLVGGVFVVRDSELVGSVYPGRAIRRTPAVRN
jgi:dihydroorotase